MKLGALILTAVLSLPLGATTFYAIRHGESVPSFEKRVCATMESGADVKNRLTLRGRDEVAQSATTWITANKEMLAREIRDNKFVIVASPFSRTKETAEIVADLIHKTFGRKINVLIENDLRERNFGEFEGKLDSDKVYAQVWTQDAKDAGHTKWEVESIEAVRERTRGLVKRLAGRDEKMFLLVSHGDTLKVLQTVFSDSAVTLFKTAEIRKFGSFEG